VSRKVGFWRWLAEQAHRDDLVGQYARRMRDVQPDAKGERPLPAGFHGHARAALLEFAAAQPAVKP